MYTGTCELYDAHSKGADGNWGWACYNLKPGHHKKIVKQYETRYGYC